MFHHVQTSSGKNRRRSEERGKVQNWRVHQVLWCTFWSDLGLLWESDFNNSGLSYSRDMLHGLCSVWVQLQLVSRVHTKGLYQKIKLLSPNPLRYTMSAKIIEKLRITIVKRSRDYKYNRWQLLSYYQCHWWLLHGKLYNTTCKLFIITGNESRTLMIKFKLLATKLQGSQISSAKN